MKDYELINKLEHDLFREKESYNFLKASMHALDGGIEEKRKTFEKMKKDYDERTTRMQVSMERIKKQIATLEQKLNDARGVQSENAKKRALMHKVKKKIEKKKTVNKEPEPTFVPPPPIEEDIVEETVENLTVEEIKDLLDELPEPQKKENGKKICPICGAEFSPQGFASHFRSCSVKMAEELERGD